MNENEHVWPPHPTAGRGSARVRCVLRRRRRPDALGRTARRRGAMRPRRGRPRTMRARPHRRERGCNPPASGPPRRAALAWEKRCRLHAAAGRTVMRAIARARSSVARRGSIGVGAVLTRAFRATARALPPHQHPLAAQRRARARPPLRATGLPRCARNATTQRLRGPSSERAAGAVRAVERLGPPRYRRRSEERCGVAAAGACGAGQRVSYGARARDGRHAGARSRVGGAAAVRSFRRRRGGGARRLVGSGRPHAARTRAHRADGGAPRVRAAVAAGATAVWYPPRLRPAGAAIRARAGLPPPRKSLSAPRSPPRRCV
jgi:hypothetical protein